MRITSVTAHEFGPLQNDMLELAAGMTVVHGGNECGKSSWHSAIFAALCGRRRGRGNLRADEKRFVDRHRPWDSQGWLVSAQIVLDDGRHIELRQDLANKVDCQATDLGLGCDVSSEIMNDGAPDASKWLGLDRTSFAATACVEQAQIARVHEEAEALQDHLQRAAATAGSAATAAIALDRIEKYLKDRVGGERATTKPFWIAQQRVTKARKERDARKSAHAEYLDRVEKAEKLRDDAKATATTVRVYEAAAAISSANTLEQRTCRASELQAKYGTVPPPSTLAEDVLAQQVSGALTAWQTSPSAPIPPERSSKQLREEIAGLPEAPNVDIHPHPSVLQAADRLRSVSEQLTLHRHSRPPESMPTPPIAASDEELLELAQALQPPMFLRNSAGEPQTFAARNADSDVSRGFRSSMVLIAAAVAMTIVDAMLFATGNKTVGIAVAVVAAALLIAGVAQRVAGDVSARHKQVDRQAMLEAEMTRRREQASARCGVLGIVADPTALRRIPAARARAVAHRDDLKVWINRCKALQGKTLAAAEQLSAALKARGYPIGGYDETELLTATDNYQRQCQRYAKQDAEAARRPDLMQQLSSAQAAEERAARDTQARADAGNRVLAVAEQCGAVADTPEKAAAALETWREDRTNRLSELSTKQQEWMELQKLLGDSSMAELHKSSREARIYANQLAGDVDQQLLASVDALSSTEKLMSLREAAFQAETHAATAEGEARQFAAGIRSVAEGEEDFANAEEALERVQELKKTLELTRKFLEQAQTRVHRSIAPTLAATLKDWLPAVTNGRYTDATVDAMSLQVKVCGQTRRWRKANLLSYGTMEQVYLLLRVALASHLTQGHNTCPLLLDDVTVHADAVRTREILDLLLQVAADRQVVLFTQKPQVTAWARQNLTEPRHAVRELMPVAIT
jgi:DNA repair protein SbcC/Rad50